MRAKYAAAIRDGILKGRKTRYGDIDDPYYKLRSEIIWGYSESNLRELALKAFKHSAEDVTQSRIYGKSKAEIAKMHTTFQATFDRFVETREERQYRLLREEVDYLTGRVRALENNSGRN